MVAVAQVIRKTGPNRDGTLVAAVARGRAEHPGKVSYFFPRGFLAGSYLSFQILQCVPPKMVSKTTTTSKTQPRG